MSKVKLCKCGAIAPTGVCGVCTLYKALTPAQRAERAARYRARASANREVVRASTKPTALRADYPPHAVVAAARAEMFDRLARRFER